MRVRREPTSFYFGASRGEPSEPVPPQSPLPAPPVYIPPPAPPAPAPPTQIFGLPSGASLARGQSVSSANGRTTLVHQDDGNVVLYADGQPRWATDTVGAPTYLFSMEPGGNLVLYKSDGSSFWNSGTGRYPGAYLVVSDNGTAAIIGLAGDAIWRTPIAAPAPPPRNLPGEVIDSVLVISEELKEKLRAANLLIELTVGPLPLPSGNPYVWIQETITWARNLAAVRAASPAVNAAMQLIETAFPHEDKATGFLSSISAVGVAIAQGVVKIGTVIARGVKAVAGAVGSAIRFVAGEFPSPKDYEPENLCVTAWLDPPKFALLSAVAAIVFPPSLFYIGLYVPPNMAGVTLGLAEAFVRGGTQRVIDKILDPLFDAIEELVSTLLDYAFNGNAALIRWALRKIASRLPEGVVQAITLSLAEAADAVIDALKDIQALKSENFFAHVGEAMEKVASQFSGELATYLSSMGSAIKAAARAISIVMEKGIDGLLEAVNSLTTMLLGIPADFASLARQAQVQIAQAKIFGEGGAATAILASVVQGVRGGLEGLYETAKELPFQFGEVIGDALDPISQLVIRIDEFIQNLFNLAAEGQEQGGGDLPSELPLPGDGGAVPAPASAGMSSILFALAGGLGGALLGGPIGAAAGAGAGLLLGKKGG